MSQAYMYFSAQLCLRRERPFTLETAAEICPLLGEISNGAPSPCFPLQGHSAKRAFEEGFNPIDPTADEINSHEPLRVRQGATRLFLGIAAQATISHYRATAVQRGLGYRNEGIDFVVEIQVIVLTMVKIDSNIL